MAYGGLGDVIFLLPAIQALRKHFTDAHFTYVTSGETAGARVLEDLAGIPKENIIYVPWAALKEGVDKKIKFKEYDLAIVPYTAPVRLYRPHILSIPVRIGHCRQIRTGGILARLRLEIWEEELFRKITFNRKVWIEQNGEHEIDMALRLAYAAGVPQGTSRIPEIETSIDTDAAAWKLLAQKGIREGDKLIGFQLGISPAMGWKQWGPERFGEIASQFFKNGNKIVLLGSSAESGLVSTFLKICPEAVNALGLNLAETAAVMKRCKIFIANDSGPAKLAMALGVKTAIVWGPSDRFGAGPWQDGHISLATGISCSPCFALGLKKTGSGVLNFDNCGHRSCLRDLSIADAYKKIQEAL